MAFRLQIHSAVAIGIGQAIVDQKRIPIVGLQFAKDLSTLRQLESGELDSAALMDQRLWTSYGLSVRAARQLITDLTEAVDQAITDLADEE